MKGAAAAGISCLTLDAVTSQRATASHPETPELSCTVDCHDVTSLSGKGNMFGFSPRSA